MKTRLTRKMHVFFEKYFTEQRLYLRSDTSTRFLRLTPSTQMGIAAAFIVLFGWTVFVSSAFLINTLGAGSDSRQAAQLQLDYEARLNLLSSERDKRAREAQKAQERFYVALEQISKQQSLLLASEDRRRELETGIEVIQRTLRKTMKQRDHAEIQADKLLNELQAVNGSISTQYGAAEDVNSTLQFMTSALARTVEERDEMQVETSKMESKVSDLKHQAKLTKERNARIFARLEEAVAVSISPLEKMFETVGLSTDKLLKDVKSGYSGTGGPLTPLAVSTKGQPEDATSLKANELLAEMDGVNMLRIAAERLPFAMPLRSSYRMSSPFGWRRHPTSGKTRMHEGVDMAAASGTPLYSTADGVVTYAGWAGGYGRVIKIRHAMGFETRYGHLAKIRVKKGQRVSRGDRIGDMGSSGRSTGPHVHYEVRVGGKAVNPMKYIKAARNVF